MASVADQIQQKLSDLGYGSAATNAVIRKFQADHGLMVDGYVGPQTLGALGITAPVQQVLDSSFKPTLSAAEAAQALNAGYQKVTGEKPSAPILGLLLGQTALETGNWKSMPNYNFGGMKASSGDEYVQTFGTTEVVNGATQAMQAKFAAFKSAADGAAAYIRMLQSRPHWWDGLHSGSAEGFIQGLTTAPAYFTANPATYLAGLKSRMGAFYDQAVKYAGAPVAAIEQVAMFKKGKGLGVAFWAGVGAVGFGAFKLYQKKRSQRG